MSKLQSPIVRVRLETPGSDDLVEYVVQSDNRDMVQLDIIRARKSWPSLQEAPILGLTVISWHALSRSGQIGTQGLDAFMAQCVEVVGVDENHNPITAESGNEVPGVDPTQAVAVTAS